MDSFTPRLKSTHYYSLGMSVSRHVREIKLEVVKDTNS